MSDLSGIAHINLRIPTGGDDAAEDFWCGLLGLTVHEKPKGNEHAGRWFAAGGFEIHVSPDDAFVPASKAHIAFIVDDVTTVAKRLVEGGVEVKPARGSMDDLTSCFFADPFGNRLEMMTAWGAENPD
jgi:catechol 2,3-dioxygenase-like lactoylglutathione lyase family enzyme